MTGPKPRWNPPPAPPRDSVAEAGVKIIFIRFLTRAGTGVETAVSAAATSISVTFANGATENDASYGVVVTPNWSTTVYVDTKTTTGFTAHFGTGAPANAVIDWVVFRRET